MDKKITWIQRQRHKVPVLFKKEEGRRSPASQAELFAHIWYFSFLNKTMTLDLDSKPFVSVSQEISNLLNGKTTKANHFHRPLDFMSITVLEKISRFWLIYTVVGG